ncbi:hypothetical protein ACGFZL_11545 [Streptomyces sp. NPDC048182]
MAAVEALLDSRSSARGMGRGPWTAGLAVLGAGGLLACWPRPSSAPPPAS